MKTIVFALVALSAFSAFADEYVQGYVRKDGTYVAPHHRTAPDNSLFNNYSTQGNVNPYTGQAGTVNPYQHQQQQQQQVQPMFQPLQQQQQCGYVYGQYVCR